MSAPIERAADAMRALDDHRMYVPFQDFARAAFKSIDVDELARVIVMHLYEDHDTIQTAAHAVIAHLTKGASDE